MKSNSRLAAQIENGGFIITAECLSRHTADATVYKQYSDSFNRKIAAVNAADNHSGVTISSLATSMHLINAGVEPVLQVLTRDCNRIALQSEILGAVSLGIKNVLCLSGYHQSLAGNPQSANVYDIDSIQLISVIRRMKDEGLLLNGRKMEGDFSMLIGAAASPLLKPLPLNMLRVHKKIAAGADFIQTQAVFDMDILNQWMGVAYNEGITEKAAILVGIRPLASAAEAEELNTTCSDIVIPDCIIARLKAAGAAEAQYVEGLSICAELISQIRGVKGARGIHIFSKGRESIVPQLIKAASL